MTTDQLCGSLYPSRSRQPNTRIVHCDLPAGHDGDHMEQDTESTWPRAEPVTPTPAEPRGEDCCAGDPDDPRGFHALDCPVYLADVEELEQRRSAVPLAQGGIVSSFTSWGPLDIPAPFELPKPMSPEAVEEWMVRFKEVMGSQRMTVLPDPFTLISQDDIAAAYERGKAEQAAEVERLQALLEQAEQHARDSQDELLPEVEAEAYARGLAEGRAQGRQLAITAVRSQAALPDLMHFDRPSDFRKGVLSCLAALEAGGSDA